MPRWVSVRRGANTLTPGATTLGGERWTSSRSRAPMSGAACAPRWAALAARRAAGRGRPAGRAVDGRISVSGDRYDGYRHRLASQRDALHANVGFQAAGLENRTYLSWTDLDFDIPTVVLQGPRAHPAARCDGRRRHAAGPVAQRLPPRPAPEATQLRLANRSRWVTMRCARSCVYWQDTDDLFNNQTSYTITRSRTAGAQWQASGQTAGPLAWRAALGWSRSRMDRDLDATSPVNGAALQRFGAYDLTADNLQALLAADWRPAGQADAGRPAGATRSATPPAAWTAARCNSSGAFPRPKWV